MKMVVYMDGGSQIQQGYKKYILSWGVVAHHNDETVELHGALTGVPSTLSGSHEHIAFVEALRHAQKHSVAPEELSFVTDDASVCNVNDFARNFGKVDMEHNTIRRLKLLLDYVGEPGLERYMLDCLMWGKFQKVKGHARTVYNLRCDELAVHARNWAKGDLSPLLPFEEWLHDGHVYYDKEQQRKTWFAPFSDLQEA